MEHCFSLGKSFRVCYTLLHPRGAYADVHVTFLLLLITACLMAMPVQEERTLLPVEQQEELFTQSVQTFSDKLFFATGSQVQNRMISPLSVLLALGMTANGAAGETQQEILGVLTDSSLSLEDLNQASLAYLKQTPKEVSIANSLWANDRMDLSSTFLARVRKAYRAEASNLDFQAQKSTKVINDWVKDATKGAIDSIIDEVQPDMMLYLINAISFKDAWRSEFEIRATRTMTFHAERGDIQTPFLNQQSHFRYLHQNRASYLYLPYKNERYTMVTILPDKECGVYSFLETQKQTSFSASLFKCLDHAGYEYIDLSLPKFESRYSDSLKDELQDLGMRRSFDAGLADFSAMLASNKPEAVIDEVLHKTFIRVDEAGTEAAAVTAVMMKATSMAPMQSLRLVLDRPFVYAILDLERRIPLFLGVLDNPNP